MNRRSFFKFLGIGAATAVITPRLLTENSMGMSGNPINKIPFTPKPGCVRHTPKEFGFSEYYMNVLNSGSGYTSQPTIYIGGN